MKIVLSTALFDTLENPPTVPDVSLDYADELDALINAPLLGDVQMVELSAKLVRFYEMLDETGHGVGTKYEFRLSGTGMKPVSTLSGLFDAIGSGVASGAFSDLKVLRAGVEFLDISFGTSGYVVTTGHQVITIAGSLPTTFHSLFTLANLLSTTDNLSFMTDTERTAWFDALSAYSTSGFSVADSGVTVFAVSHTATAFSMTVGGLTFAATGVIPTDFGQLAEVIYQASANRMASGSDLSVALSQFSVDGLTITDSASHVILQVTGINDGLADDYVLAGRHYSDAQLGTIGETGIFLTRDILTGPGGGVRSVLTGLNGDDVLTAFGGADALFGGTGGDYLDGGTGNDRIYGGAGFDVAVFTGPLNATVDLRLAVAQNTGFGTDLIVGVEGIQSGAGNDNLTGTKDQNYLVSGKGNDTIHGLGGGDDILGGAGNDVLYGGLGRDHFHFNSLRDSATAIGVDVIKDFDVAADRLVFDASHLGPDVWDSMSKSAFLSHYAHVEAGNVIIALNADNRIVLEGLTSLVGLAADLIY